MRPNMLLEVRQLREFTLADLAAVGLDPEMYPRVLGEIGAIRERLATLRALVGFRLSHMGLRVQLQLGLGAKHLWTHFALIFSGLWPSAVLHAAHFGSVDRLWNDE